MNINKNNKKMLTSDNFSLQESFNDNDINDLKNKISYNEKTIKEFESHLRSLLTIAKESELDYAFQVQKGLEKIKYLVEDNVTSKRLLLKEYKKGEELEKEINKLNKEIEENNNVLKNNEKGKAIIEKHQLLSNINTLSNEIDKLSEINNQNIKIIKMKDNPKNYNKLMEEIDKIKQENDSLMNVINYVELNKVFNFEEKSNNFFSCMGNGEDIKYSYNLN
jgi:hypothetical protein